VPLPIWLTISVSEILYVTFGLNNGWARTAISALDSSLEDPVLFLPTLYSVP